MNVAECNKQLKVLSQKYWYWYWQYFSKAVGIGNTFWPKYCYWYWQYFSQVFCQHPCLQPV